MTRKELQELVKSRRFPIVFKRIEAGCSKAASEGKYSFDYVMEDTDPEDLEMICVREYPDLLIKRIGKMITFNWESIIMERNHD